MFGRWTRRMSRYSRVRFGAWARLGKRLGYKPFILERPESFICVLAGPGAHYISIRVQQGSARVVYYFDSRTTPSLPPSLPQSASTLKSGPLSSMGSALSCKSGTRRGRNGSGQSQLVGQDGYLARLFLLINAEFPTTNFISVLPRSYGDFAGLRCNGRAVI